MTDNEIIKALEHNANKCRLYEASERQGLYKSTLDLINRQKAEIGRLNIELQSMRNAANSYKMHYENAKSEAIKEFAEGLCDGRVSNDPVVIAVKVELEMTEGQKK